MDLAHRLRHYLDGPNAQRTLYGCLAAGLLLGGWLVLLRAYRDTSSLYVDEACLAMNVLTRDFSGLARGLDDNQTAPLIFLWLVKASTLGLGEGEEALRGTGFIASLATLPLVFLSALKLTNRRGALLALFFAAVSPTLIAYATMFKQYAFDAMVTAGLIWLGVLFLRGRQDWPRVAGMALVGALAVWSSFPAVYPLAAAGSAWFFQRIKERAKRGGIAWSKLILVAAAWLGSFAGYYFLQLRGVQQIEYLQDYWLAGYPPDPARGWFFWNWFLQIPQMIFDLRLPFVYASAAGMFVIIGAVFHLRSGKPEGLVVALPGVFAVLGALLHAYPLEGRLAVFLIPTGILLAAHGIETIASQLQRFRTAFMGTVVFLIAAFPLSQAIDPALRNYNPQELRPVVRRILENWQDGDKMYVYYAGKCSFSYYARQFQIPAGDYELGDEWTGRLAENRIEYLTAAFDPLRGRSRIWMVFNHVRFNDLEDGLAILDGMGRRLYEYIKPGSSVYLYDLSAPPVP
jgi:uncharacterized membrane protein